MDAAGNPTPPDGDPTPEWHPLCAGADLADSGLGVSFQVRYDGRVCPAFAVRHRGQVHAYLNRCSHVALELDWMPGRFFDLSGQLLVCAAHGALFRPDTGECVGGPGRGPLVKIETAERAGGVFWRSQYRLQAIEC